jgi:hypothetical protein
MRDYTILVAVADATPVPVTGSRPARLAEVGFAAVIVVFGDSGEMALSGRLQVELVWPGVCPYLGASGRRVARLPVGEIPMPVAGSDCCAGRLHRTGPTGSSAASRAERRRGIC